MRAAPLSCELAAGGSRPQRNLTITVKKLQCIQAGVRWMQSHHPPMGRDVRAQVPHIPLALRVGTYSAPSSSSMRLSMASNSPLSQSA